MIINPIALKMAKTLWSFGHSECNRVKGNIHVSTFTGKQIGNFQIYLPFNGAAFLYGLSSFEDGSFLPMRQNLFYF